VYEPLRREVSLAKLSFPDYACTIDRNCITGVFLGSSSSNNTITENNVRGNGVGGVLLKYGIFNSTSENTISSGNPLRRITNRTIF